MGADQLGTVLRERRCDAGISVWQLARDLQLSPAQVHRIEDGAVGVDDVLLGRMLRATRPRCP